MVGLVESVLFGELGEPGNKRLDYRRPFANEVRTGLGAVCCFLNHNRERQQSDGERQGWRAICKKRRYGRVLEGFSLATLGIRSNDSRGGSSARG